MRFKTVVNVTTGETIELPYTPEEEAEADAMYEEWLITQLPTSADVNKERNRRMKIFAFGGKEYSIDPDDGSLANVSGAGTLALGAIVAGAQPGNLRWADPNVDFSWIADDNSLTTMDAQTTWAFAQAAAAWRKTMIYKARAIKDQQTIPTNYKNNSHWE